MSPLQGCGLFFVRFAVKSADVPSARFSWGSALRVLHGPSTPAFAVRVSPDGRVAAALHLLGNGGPLHTLSVWDLHAGAVEPYRVVEGNFSGFAFSGTGEWIAVAGDAVHFVRTSDLGRLGGLTTQVAGVSTKPDADAVWLAQSDSQRALLVTSSPTNGPHQAVPLDGTGRLQAQIGTMDLAPDGNRLALVYLNQNNPRAGLVIGLFDLEKKKLVDRFSTRRRQIQALRFAPDGRMLAVLTPTQVLVWDVVTKKRLALLEPKSGKESRFTLAVEFGRDGRRLFIGTDDGLHLYDTTTWTPTRRYDFDIGPILSLAMTPDGLCGLAGGNSGRIAVWDLDD